MYYSISIIEKFDKRCFLVHHGNYEMQNIGSCENCDILLLMIFLLKTKEATPIFLDFVRFWYRKNSYHFLIIIMKLQALIPLIFRRKTLKTCPDMVNLLCGAARMSSTDDRPKFSNFFKNVRNSNFQCHIWIQYEKCIKMGNNNPQSICAVVLEPLEFWGNSFKFQLFLFKYKSVASV